MTTIQSPTLDEVRVQAYDLYAEWQAKWSKAHNDDITGEHWLEDLIEYSADDLDYEKAEHDHVLYVLHPSVGDEAGTWTLYVVASLIPPHGVVIEAIWQVFDTMPQAVYENPAAAVDVVWYNTPKED